MSQYRHRGPEHGTTSKEPHRGISKFFSGHEVFRIWPEAAATNLGLSGININVPVWNAVTVEPPGEVLPGNTVVRFPLSVLEPDGTQMFSARCNWTATYAGVTNRTAHIIPGLNFHSWVSKEPVPPSQEMEVPEEGFPAEVYTFEFHIFIGEWLSRPGPQFSINQNFLGTPEELVLPTYVFDPDTLLWELDNTVLIAK